MAELEIRTRDNAITGWARVDPDDGASEIAAIAQITWLIYPGRWHVDFLRAEQARHLLPMLVAFRIHWRAGGKPALTFRMADDNVEMQRLALMLGARRVGDVYEIEYLPGATKSEGYTSWPNRPSRS